MIIDFIYQLLCNYQFSETVSTTGGRMPKLFILPVVLEVSYTVIWKKSVAPVIS